MGVRVAARCRPNVLRFSCERCLRLLHPFTLASAAHRLQQLVAGTPCEVFRPYYRCGNSLHAVTKSCAECRPNRLGVRGRIRARQQDVLRESCSAIRQRVKPPLERQCGSIERHFDDEKSVRCDGPDLPPQWVLPLKQRRTPTSRLRMDLRAGIEQAGRPSSWRQPANRAQTLGSPRPQLNVRLQTHACCSRICLSPPTGLTAVQPDG